MYSHARDINAAIVELCDLAVNPRVCDSGFDLTMKKKRERLILMKNK